MFALARRSRNRVLGVILALGVPAVALVPVAASGEPQAKPAKGAQGEKAATNDPENVVAISQYMEMVVKANERFVAKDTTTAIDGYKKAVLLNPKNPLGPYLLAEAYIAAGNLPEAEAAVTQALEASDSRNPTLRAQVLFVVADLSERQKKWDRAKLAWQAYAEHAAKFSGDASSVFPQTSAERLKAIQKVLDMEKAYVAVRERIAIEKADAGKSAPKK